MKPTLDSRTVLAQHQSLPLEAKIHMSLNRIKDWYEYWDGQVYTAFSAGKDSTVLDHLVTSLYPEVPAVFSNTGLEYPEIISFYRAYKERHGDRIISVRPKTTFREVILNEGFAIISKKVARQLRILREHKDDPKWANSYKLYNIGVRSDGVHSPQSKLPEKYRHLVSGPFKISELCCDRLKKEPLLTYERSTGRKRMMGMMAAEGGMRSAHRAQCNVYSGSGVSSAPMWFWSEKDVWEYIRSRGLAYSKIYDMGESRTGCMFCVFGAHLEKGANRFQRMFYSHPKIWDYCINRLGMSGVLDAIGVKYVPEAEMALKRGGGA